MACGPTVNATHDLIISIRPRRWLLVTRLPGHVRVTVVHVRLVAKLGEHLNTEIDLSC